MPEAPPIVSDATMTGTDSPRSLPRSSSRDRSVEQEATGDVSLFAGLADYPFEYEAEADFFLPPPLKAAKIPSPARVVSPARKVSTAKTVSPPRVASPSQAGSTGKDGTVQQSIEAGSTLDNRHSASPAPSANGSLRATELRSKFRPAVDESTSTAPASTSKQVGRVDEMEIQRPHERNEQEAAIEPRVSKFFESPTKRKRASKAREETPAQESVPRSKDHRSIERPADDAIPSSRRSDKKGKRRQIVQSDEEDEQEQDQIEPCPICGQMVSFLHEVGSLG